MNWIRSMLAGATLIALSSITWAGPLTIPNTFTPGTPAKASEVNTNFTAVKTAVDDNHNRISNIEAARFSPIKFASATNLSGNAFQNTIWTVGPLLTLTPAQSGTVLVSMQAKFPYQNALDINLICGIYVNSTGIQPTGNTGFNSSVDVFFNESTTDSFSKTAVIHYPFQVQSNQIYYVWVGFRHEDILYAGSSFGASSVNLIATLHSNSGL